MFRITEDPSSGSLVQCLAKNYKNDSIVSVDMAKFSVMAAYSDRVCSSLYRKAQEESKYIFFHIRTAHFDTIKVSFIHQLMHQ